MYLLVQSINSKSNSYITCYITFVVMLAQPQLLPACRTPETSRPHMKADTPNVGRATSGDLAAKKTQQVNKTTFQLGPGTETTK